MKSVFGKEPLLYFREADTMIWQEKPWSNTLTVIIIKLAWVSKITYN